MLTEHYLLVPVSTLGTSVDLRYQLVNSVMTASAYLTLSTSVRVASVKTTSAYSTIANSALRDVP